MQIEYWRRLPVEVVVHYYLVKFITFIFIISESDLLRLLRGFPQRCLGAPFSIGLTGIWLGGGYLREWSP